MVRILWWRIPNYLGRMVMAYAVIVENLVKCYGRFTALKGISFSVNEGEVFGLIGPNGAGKTTTLRIIATLLKPTSGTVKVYGFDVVKDANKVKSLIGYLPEEAGLYERLTGYENLLFFAKLYARDKRELDEIVEYGIKIANLGDRIHDKVKSYSKGMKRRLTLARTLMVKPKLAILDEPTVGLDVYAAVNLRNTIKRYVRETGNTVLFSSHNMLEVEYLCDRVALINNGVIVAKGTPKEIKERFNTSNLEEAFIKAMGVNIQY